MKHPHKSQAAAMERAGELTDGELSMSMFASREDYDKAVKRQEANDNIEYFVDQLKSHVKEFFEPLPTAVPLIRGILQLYAKDFAASSAALAAERAEVARLREALKELRLVVPYFWDDDSSHIEELDAACEKADEVLK